VRHTNYSFLFKWLYFIAQKSGYILLKAQLRLDK